MYSHGDPRVSNKDRFIRATIQIQMLQKHRTLGTEHNYKERQEKIDVIHDKLYNIYTPVSTSCIYNIYVTYIKYMQDAPLHDNIHNIYNINTGEEIASAIHPTRDSVNR